MKRKSTGLTLIELMVVVVIVGIFAAAAAPNFTSFIDKSRVKGAADDVASLIASARTGAVKRSRNVTVAVTGTANSTTWCLGGSESPAPASAGALMPASAACTCTTANSCQVDGRPAVVSAADYPGVTIGALPAAFTFDGRLGVLDNLAATPGVTLTSAGGYQLTVSVSPMGQTRVCVSAGGAISGYPAC